MPSKPIPENLQLFLSFFKIGAFTFGGGYAMLPLIQAEVTQRRGWISEDDMLNIIAVSESTPGPISINCATFIGAKRDGLRGAFSATLGVVLPSFLVILLISYLLQDLMQYRLVAYAFFGIRAAVPALIFRALLSMAKKCPLKLYSVVSAAIAFAASIAGISIPAVLLAAALAGIIAGIHRRKTADSSESKGKVD